MPRKPVERSRTHFYHITARSNNKEYFYLPLPDIWNIMTKKLSELQLEHGIVISSFVLMNNHFHLLMLTPNEDIDRIMYFFMKEVTLKIQKRTGRINKIFGGRYKGSIIAHHAHLLNVYKYIYRNPVEAGLTNRAELYPYSTLFYSFHGYKLPMTLEEVMGGSDRSQEIAWLNHNFEIGEAESIKSGLQKTFFAYKRDRASGKIIEPEISPELFLTHRLRKSVLELG